MRNNQLSLLLVGLVLLIGVFGCSNDNGNGSSESTPPAQITDLQMVSTYQNAILIIWTSTGDDADTGRARTYDVRYSAGALGDTNWNTAMKATSEPKPQIAGHAESFVIRGLTAGTSYLIAIKASDDAGNFSTISNVVPAKTSSTGLAEPDDDTPPAVIDDLRVEDFADDSLTILWTSPGDDGITGGTAARYDLRYSTISITEENWRDAIHIPGVSFPQFPQTFQRFVVTGLSPQTDYYFAIKTRDEVHNWSELSAVAHGKTLAKLIPLPVSPSLGGIEVPPARQ